MNRRDFELSIIRVLFGVDPFFAALSKYIDKIPTNNIPTMGVKAGKRFNYQLFYNPEFVDTLNDDQLRDVLRHEFYHIILAHTEYRASYPPLLWNYAADLAVNSHLKHIPEWGLHPGKGMFKDYPAGLSAEEYVARLYKEIEKLPKDYDFGHDWEDGEGENKQGKEISKQKLREVLRKVISDSLMQGSSSWGSIPEHLQKQIQAFAYGKLDWREILRYFVKASQRSEKSNTVKRVNKRYAGIHPGSRWRRSATIAVSIDQSGSVSDELLEAFYGELNNLSKLATFIVVPFDCEVDENLVFEWKKGKSIAAERVKMGGTDFNAPTDYVNKRGDIDGHIILTDMKAEKPIPSFVPRMWVTDDSGKSHCPFSTDEQILSID